MLRPVPMAHFRAQVPNRDAAAATRAIAAAGMLHLVDVAHGRAPYDAAPPGVRELYASFRDLLQRVRATAERLGIVPADLDGGLADDAVSDFAAERDRIAVELEPLEKRVQALARERGAARDRAAAARDAAANGERIARASLDVARLRELRFTALRLGIAAADALPAISASLSPVSHVVVPLAEEDGGIFFAAAVPATARARLDGQLQLAAAQPVPLDAGDAGVAAAQRAEADAERAIAEERAKSAEFLRELARRAEIATLLLQAQTYFAAAGRFLVVSGWVPQAEAERLRRRVVAATGGRAIVEVEPAVNLAALGDAALRVPILHRNPLLLRPFQKLVDMYGTPSYAEVEPTAFFAIAFLAMFGLMFGDVGHGAVLFAAGWLLFRYLPRFLDYGILLMEAGTASAVFGVLYGSVFGIRTLLPALWLEPLDDLPRFMLVAAGFGVVIVTGGLILNVFNSWRSGDFRAALTGPRGVAGALLYWIVLVLLVRAFFPSRVRVPAGVIVALVAAVVVLIAATPWIVRALPKRPAPAVRATPLGLRALESSVELVDTLFSFFANTVSFVRVAAFAAVHCGVFIAVFALAETMGALPLGGLWAGVVYVAGNAVVIVLEGLTVSVQVLRLEYYEFFGKFFRGGGEPYAPLSLPMRSVDHA